MDNIFITIEGQQQVKKIFQMLYAQTTMQTIQNMPGRHILKGIYYEILRQLEDQQQGDLILVWQMEWDSHAVQAMYQANSIIAEEITHNMNKRANEDEPLDISLS